MSRWLGRRRGGCDEGPAAEEAAEGDPATAISALQLAHPALGSAPRIDILAESHPTADAEGRLAYQRTVDRAQLEAMLAEGHGIEELALEERVVFLHGVSEEAGLPETVESLPDVPARATLLVACGELELLAETSAG